jgi:uncharacterized protein (DUF1330 family)
MSVDLLNITGLKELEHQGPVVMVNLMRFHDRSLDGDGSGWDAYLRYSALTVPMIKARGGTLLWTGDAKAVALGPQDGNQWDYLALVYYPSVADFIDMMTSADYENLSDPHRRNGCAEHVIIATAEAYSKFRIGQDGGCQAAVDQARCRRPSSPARRRRRFHRHDCETDRRAADRLSRRLATTTRRLISPLLKALKNLS